MGGISDRIQTIMCNSCHSHRLLFISCKPVISTSLTSQSVAVWSFQSCPCTYSPSTGTVPLVITRSMYVIAVMLCILQLGPCVPRWSLARGLFPLMAQRGRWAPAVVPGVGWSRPHNWYWLQKRSPCRGTMLPWTNTFTISADGTSCRKRSRGRREGNCFFNLI